ncbi:NADH dehydrogenase [Pontibacillus halophilus JSM 076056 = DSM 19796]|uniref:NADH dehydrogenase n=1 Tax=Pontibacillus halophilus JSM 076056 = DSM 19796 TaxID=1385510 RepID=A0A0A5GHY1_9BACI|nr:FAD-dependent oxidoreductase [Pontibacillus halophilus]KGX90730.1 NADH dehydrogenase [Pontibacillus halophilus JSM 076056 = DSM 19796]
MRRIVLLGGGYGGLKIAHQLLSQLPDDVEITLIDRNPYHTMKTEFYALAAGTIAEKEVRSAFPYHEQLRIMTDTVHRIDLEREAVVLHHHDRIYYDYLVIGLGSEDKFHGIEGARDHTYKISTIYHTRKTYEAVNNVKNFGQISIVGGGLSGVEMAAELRESRPDLNIRLLDQGGALLKAFPEDIQVHAKEWFEEHDVELVFHSNVDYVEPNIVCNTGVCLLTDATIWTAGIKPNRVIDSLAVKKDAAGRIVLNDFHQVVGVKNVYVVGDCASMELPPSAQLAEQQGKQIAEGLLRELNGKPPKPPSEIVIKGTLGTLGNQDGFGLTFNRPLKGMLPRVIKTGVLWYHKFKSL